MSRFIDISGQRFSRLVPMYVDGRNSVGRNTWRCLCDCGRETFATTNQLKTGRKISCGCAKNILPKGEGSFNWLYGHYKRQAQVHKREFSISKELFRTLTSSNCIYCGRVPQSLMAYKGMNGEYRYNGLDRVDSSKGYIETNVVSCCDICNRAKNDQTTEEFYWWILRVYNKFILKSNFDGVK